MNIYKTTLFPYIEGESLLGKEVTLTMTNVVTEELPTHGGKTEEKFVLYFKESPKGLILNKTNAKAIAQLYGPETSDWDGQRITLFSERVKAFGETHNAARVKAPTNGNGNGKATGPNTAPPMPQQTVIEAASKAKQQAKHNYTQE